MVEHYPNYQDFNDLVELINNSENDFDLQLIQKAYLLARSAHKDQRRVSVYHIFFIQHQLLVFWFRWVWIQSLL